MKRVALYYPWIYLRGGAERVILEIVRRTRHRYTVFTNHLESAGTFPELRDFERLVVLHGISTQRSPARVIGGLVTIARQRLDLRTFDALLVASDGFGDLITLRNRAKPLICFCHSLARPAYDVLYRASLVKRHPYLRWILPLVTPPYRVLTRLAWRRYRRVFVNSGTTRQQVLAHSLCAPDAVEILYPGVDPVTPPSDGRFEPFFLYAGRIKWTKNVELAVQAFHALRDRAADGGPWSLVVAGQVDEGSVGYVEQLRRLSERDAGVVYRLNPSGRELEALYARCSALIFPSLNEPWGIVPLEAMAHGKPVLAVNRGGPAESVVHGETGYLLEPTVAAFAAAMERLARDPALCERLGRQAAAHVRRYSWAAFVARLDDYVDTLA